MEFLLPPSGSFTFRFVYVCPPEVSGLSGKQQTALVRKRIVSEEHGSLNVLSNPACCPGDHFTTFKYTGQPPIVTNPILSSLSTLKSTKVKDGFLIYCHPGHILKLSQIPKQERLFTGFRFIHGLPKSHRLPYPAPTYSWVGIH